VTVDAAEVEVRFDAEGAIRVLSFVWQGAKHPVTSQGRQWEAADGRHILVMTTGDRVFELAWDGQGPWQVLKVPGREMMA
jgi:hypothetical protein